MELDLVKVEDARIDTFLKTLLPENWKHWSLEQRRKFWRSGGHGGVAPRGTVCAMEIWQELFGRDRATYEQKWARKINDIIKKDTRWRQSTSVDCGQPYGRQRGFILNESRALPPRSVKRELPTNDYFVITYRFLSYLYMCFKAGNSPSSKYLSSGAFGISTGYWTNIVKSLLHEGYIVGAEVQDFTITQKGIEVLYSHPLIREAAKMCQDYAAEAGDSLRAG